MRAVCGLAAGAAVLMHGCANTESSDQDFKSFVAKYNRKYDDEADQLEHERIFNANMDVIKAENAKHTSFKLGVTEFADIAQDEFETRFLGFVQTRLYDASAPNHTLTRAELPSSVDWRNHNGKQAVTEVKNQNPCGTCWSFAQTAAIEGIRAIKGGPLESLSNQEMMDCLTPSHPCTGAGAGGGLTEGVMYAKQHGLYSYKAYPFVAATESCRSPGGSKALAANQITGFVNVPSNDENALMDALSQQPVAVAVNAQYGGPIQHYTTGVIHTYCSSQLDHAVLAIGYGRDSATGLDYWLIKNSWGPYWGEEGYFRLERGKQLCGILAWSSYPTMA